MGFNARTTRRFRHQHLHVRVTKIIIIRRSRSWWGGRREAVRGGGGRVRSAVWFGPGRFGPGRFGPGVAVIAVIAGTVAAAGVSGLELRPRAASWLLGKAVI
jgi:hypothetical protein